MPLRYEENQIIRRTANGECFMQRICTECGNSFTGSRRICPKCRYAKRKAEGKYNKKYHRNYYRRFLSKTARINGTIRKSKDNIRTIALEKQRQRIYAEISAIQSIGLTETDTIETIEQRAAQLLMKAS